MIALTSQTASGYVSHYVSPRAIARVTETGASSQWHGIRAIVKMFDGEVLEVSETADHIRALLEKQGGAA